MKPICLELQMHPVFPDSISSGKGDSHTSLEPFNSTILCERLFLHSAKNVLFVAFPKSPKLLFIFLLTKMKTGAI